MSSISKNLIKMLSNMHGVVDASSFAWFYFSSSNRILKFWQAHSKCKLIFLFNSILFLILGNL